MNRDLRSRRLWLAGALLTVAAALAALYLLRGVLLTLALSGAIAYLLFPLARGLERVMPGRERRPGLCRSLAVSLIFLAFLGLLAAAVLLVISSLISQGQRFIADFPQFIAAARGTLEFWIADYNRFVPAPARDRAEEWLSDAGGLLGNAAWNIAAQTFGAVAGSIAFVIGLATAPVLIFYLLKDSEALRESLYAPFPARLRPYLRDLLDIASRSVGGYIRGQLVLGVIVGGVVTGGLLILGIPFAVILGIVAGLTELIPIIGPWIGGAAGVLVTLAAAPDKALWVILLYLAVQLLENALLAPRVQANTLGLHPIAVILVITIGSQYFGLGGIILGPPLAAMVKGMIGYAVQEWNRPPADADSGIDAAGAGAGIGDGDAAAMAAAAGKE